MYFESLKVVVALVAVAVPFYVAFSVLEIIRASRARGDTRPAGPGIAVGTPRRVPLLESLVDRAFSFRDRRLCALLVELLQPGATVCDVGCGDGTLLRALEENGFDACGLDVDINMVAKARSRVERAKVLHSDLSELPQRMAFDAILFCDSLRYMLQPHKLLADALNIANIVIVTEPYEVWHRVGRILFLRFLYRVDHLSTISFQDGPVVARRWTPFHQFWVLKGKAQPGSLDWFATEVAEETSWMVNSLMHPGLEASLKKMGAVSLVAGIVAVVSLFLYMLAG